MLAPLATVTELADRVGEAIVDPLDIALAGSFLRLVSAQVRHYGADWADPILVPDIAVAITIEAAARGYMNPAGFKLERGDEITVDRFELFARGSTLSLEEVAALRSASGQWGWTSVATERDVTVTDTVTLSTTTNANV